MLQECSAAYELTRFHWFEMLFGHVSTWSRESHECFLIEFLSSWSFMLLKHIIPLIALIPWWLIYLSLIKLNSDSKLCYANLLCCSRSPGLSARKVKLEVAALTQDGIEGQKITTHINTSQLAQCICYSACMRSPLSVIQSTLMLLLLASIASDRTSFLTKKPDLLPFHSYSRTSAKLNLSSDFLCGSLNSLNPSLTEPSWNPSFGGVLLLSPQYPNLNPTDWSQS